MVSHSSHGEATSHYVGRHSNFQLAESYVNRAAHEADVATNWQIAATDTLKQEK